MSFSDDPEKKRRRFGSAELRFSKDFFNWHSVVKNLFTTESENGDERTEKKNRADLTLWHVIFRKIEFAFQFIEPGIWNVLIML